MLFLNRFVNISQTMFNLTMYLLLDAFIDIGFPEVYEVFSNFIANWKWPGRLHSTFLHEIFADDRKKKHRDAKHIKCQASDGLSLIAVAAHFVVSVLLNLKKLGKTTRDCDAECYAFLALCDLVDLIVAASRMRVAPDKLLTSVETFLDLFEKAWGIEWMTPKFHWLLHIPNQLRMFGFLMACFCLERKHRVPKRYATDVTHPSQNSSKTLLMETSSHHLGQLIAPNAFNFSLGLVNGSRPSKRILQVISNALEIDQDGGDAASILVAKETRFRSVATCFAKDVILFKDGAGSFRAGVAELHCEVHGVAITLISAYNLSKLEPHGYSVWKVFEAPDQLYKFIETDQILDTVVYSELPNGNLGILLPLEYR